MSWQGLNFGPGFAAMGDSMAKGYSDYQQMIQDKMKMDIAARQAAVQEQEANYKYPSESIIPMPIGQAVAQPRPFLNNMQSDAVSGFRNSAGNPGVGVINEQGKVNWIAPPTSGAQQNPRSFSVPNTINPNRKPQGDVEANDGATVSYDQEQNRAAADAADHLEETKNIATQLGLTVNKNGQLVAKGKQGDQILALYEKLLGVGGQAYGISRNQQPELRSAPSSGGRAAQRPPDDLTTIYKTKAGQLKALQSQPFLSTLGTVQMLKLQGEVSELEKKLSGRKPQSVEELPQGASMSSTQTGAQSQGPVHKGYSKSRNQTYILNQQGQVIGVEDGDTR